MNTVICLNSLEETMHIPRAEYCIRDNGPEDYSGCFILVFELDIKAAYFTSFYIVPEARGNNIAQESLQKVIEMCKFLGFKKIILDVLFDNDVAIHIYRKFGFEFSPEIYGGIVYRMIKTL